MWLSKNESKAYPGYYEFGGGYADTAIYLTLVEGRFFKVDNGYALLAICSEIEGFREPVKTETKVVVEIHEKEYDRWISKEEGNKKVSPVWYETALVEWIEKHPDILKASVTGCFKFCTTSFSKLEVETEGLDAWLFKWLKQVEPTGKIELKLGSKTGFGGGYKSGGQGEYQKLQDRTNWLYDQYASLVNIKREGDANLLMISSLAGSIHQVEKGDSFQALQWNLLCQITGNVIAPPKPDAAF